ncbi:MAG TPA: CHAT domain-containing protein [Blastocatellia bacterium]|nr:CHAT domain-containing protein [Blastocatellia bacterium]
MTRRTHIFRSCLSLGLVLLMLRPALPLTSSASAAPVVQQPGAALDEGTLLLEYLLGEKSSALWAITTDSAQLFELPGRTEIEQAAQRVYELLTARIPRESETSLVAFRRAAQAKTQYPTAARALSQMILGPVAAQLGKKRLLIVADGALHYIPFAALPVPESGRAGERGIRKNKNLPIPPSPHLPIPLIVEHEIVYLPSASVLGMLRRRKQSLPPAPRWLALLADPVFEKDDPRFRAAATTAQPPTSGLRSANGASIAGMRGPLARLRFARAEADQIWATLSAAQREQSLTAFDFAANQDWALSPALSEYRYLHFATHGVLDQTRPELSGLALSLFDSQGRERDGFLRLVEIYNLKLAAELVTLSACETGLGKQTRGEGIIGLTRGFLHAGAQRALVSLWKVDDRASAKLMGQVYAGIFRDQLSPAAALRRAQLALRADPAMKSEFFWAAFVLHGEPR